MSKAYSQEIFKVSFSSFQEGVITSAGTGHIRFWKMATTFTGLKLQGKVGKFLKKEISDIEGYAELPDGKVLSGCEWGNMLLWEGALIKVEISRKNGKSCHVGLVQQIIFHGDRILTLGLDGYVRSWDFEVIDGMDTANETELVEIEPINELFAGEGVQLKSAIRAPPLDDEKENNGDGDDIWYAQDASGGIWKLDLSFSEPMIPPERLFTCHSGPVVALGVSPLPCEPIIASIGVDCTIRIYDYDNDNLKCMARFNQPGTALLWIPEVVDKRGYLLVAGFEDGVIRLMAIKSRKETHQLSDLHNNNQSESSKPCHTTQFLGLEDGELELILIQVAKPHRSRIVSIDVDPLGGILTTGSKDGTIFFFSTKNLADDIPKIRPMGFIGVPAAVTFIKWSPKSHDRCTLLVCCEQGHVVEIERPDQSQMNDVSNTYRLDGLKVRQHAIKINGLKNEIKDNQTRNSPGAELSNIPVSNSPQPLIPPSDVLCGFHSNSEGRAWITMGGQYSGHLYEINFLDDDDDDESRSPNNNRYNVIDLSLPSDETAHPIKCILYDEINRCFIFGRSDGWVCFHPALDDNPLPSSSSFWLLGIHDNTYGQVNSIAFSLDRRYIFTAGMDGNFFKFNYNWNVDGKIVKERTVEEKGAEKDDRLDHGLNISTTEDMFDPKALCIEEAMKKSKYDVWMKEAERRKTERKKKIEEMREEFLEIKRLNEKMPERIRLHRMEFEMDPSIGEDLNRQMQKRLNKLKSEMDEFGGKYQEELERVYNRYLKPLECDLITLKDFKGEHYVCSYRISKLSETFMATKADIGKDRKFILHDGCNSLADTASSISVDVNDVAKNSSIEIAKVKINIVGSRGQQLTKALNKVRDVKLRRSERALQWKKLFEEKPEAGMSDPDGDDNIEEARKQMGDYKLKTNEDYVTPEHLTTTMTSALYKIISLCEKIHEKKQDFNRKVFNLRQKKIIIITTITDHVKMLKVIANKLTKAHHIHDVKESIDNNENNNNQSAVVNSFESANQSDFIQSVDNVIGGKTNKMLAIGPFDGTDIDLEDVFLIPVLEPCEMADSKFEVEKGLCKGSISEFVEEEIENVSEDEITLEQNNLEILIDKAEMIKLSYQKDVIVCEIRRIKKFFDAELMLLRNIKFTADVGFANAELRLMTLSQEFDLVRNMEKDEQELTSIYVERTKEKNQLQHKIAVSKKKLNSKSKIAEDVRRKMKGMLDEFTREFKDHIYFDFLKKVYRMKGKKQKMKTLKDNNDKIRPSAILDPKHLIKCGSSSSSSSSSSDYSSDSNSSFMLNKSCSLDPRVCPPECKQEVYDKACEFRDDRIRFKDKLVECRTAAVRHLREMEELKEKLAVIEVSAASATKDLKLFQLEKQKKLNEIDVVVTLTFIQIEALDGEGKLNEDLSSVLVIPKSEILGLKKKIDDLKREKEVILKLQTEAKKKNQKIRKERKSLIEIIDKTKKECNSLIVNKFGRMVDMDTLETITINPQLEEAKYLLNSTENICFLELDCVEKEIMERKTYLAKVKRENARLLDQFNDACKDTLALEKLPSIQQSEMKEQNLSRQARKDEDEIKQLQKLVQTQSNEIREAKQAILLLSLKTGRLH